MIKSGLSFLLSIVDKVSRSPINLQWCVQTFFLPPEYAVSKSVGFRVPI